MDAIAKHLECISAINSGCQVNRSNSTGFHRQMYTMYTMSTTHLPNCAIKRITSRRNEQILPPWMLALHLRLEANVSSITWCWTCTQNTCLCQWFSCENWCPWRRESMFSRNSRRYTFFQRVLFSESKGLHVKSTFDWITFLFPKENFKKFSLPTIFYIKNSDTVSKNIVIVRSDHNHSFEFV